MQSCLEIMAALVNKYCSNDSQLIVSEPIPDDVVSSQTLAVPEWHFQSPRRKNLWKTNDEDCGSRGRYMFRCAKLLFKSALTTSGVC